MAGCIHVYCGDGKGKTTAAVGLAVRAAGCKRRVLVTRFLKTDQSGEVTALQMLPGVTVTPCEKSFGFFSQMSDEQKEEALIYYTTLLHDTIWKACSGEYDLLVLDEITAVCRFGLVSEDTVLQFLRERPAQLEVALTGRDPSEALLSIADYVSEIKKVKHPFDRGLAAREGIEY